MSEKYDDIFEDFAIGMVFNSFTRADGSAQNKLALFTF